jgi:hypothetical protein
MYSEPFRDNWLNIFDTPKSHYYISDCVVDFATGLVYKNEDIFWEGANENMAWDGGWITSDARWKNRLTRQELITERMATMKRTFEEKLQKTSTIPQYDNGTALHLLHPFGRYVYGHFYDTWQKLTIAAENKLHYDSVLLARHHEVIDFEVHLAAHDLKDMTRLPTNSGLARIKSLLFVMPVAHPTTFTVNSYMHCRNMYYRHFGISPSTPPATKIFLTRRPGAFHRALTNNDEIERVLTTAGIQFLDGSEPLEIIVKNFAAASHVAGVHGSLFVNNIFGHETTRYLEYCPRSRPCRNFENQYKLCGSYEHVPVDDVAHEMVLKIDALLAFYAS